MPTDLGAPVDGNQRPAIQAATPVRSLPAVKSVAIAKGEHTAKVSRFALPSVAATANVPRKGIHVDIKIEGPLPVFRAIPAGRSGGHRRLGWLD